ncbi:MAG TPA: thiolase family protein, partial [Acidimicrobiales bacterium]
VTWFANLPVPIGNQIVAAMNAVLAGACKTVLVYHSVFRDPSRSRSAARDPYRIRAAEGFYDMRAWHGTGHVAVEPETIFGSAAYAVWASRYVHETGLSREQLGLIALNGRANARGNPNAVMREPLTMDDYLAARMIREPLCLYDMDVPVDGGDAFVITTTERARELRSTPVLIHAATLGQQRHVEEELTQDLDHTGQAIVADVLWGRSDLKLQDVDLYYPYDGFSIITLKWFESIGYCKSGEAGAFLQDNWDDASGRLLIDGRVPVNTHGGSLSEGGTQGAGHLREAVQQLRGELDDRQVPGARTALVTAGGFFYNAQGILLRSE